MKNKREIMVLVILISIVSVASVRGVTAGPSVGEVSLSPENPTVLSNVTFTAQINGDNITAVHLIYKECDPAICKITKNITMIEATTGSYRATITLAYAKATYMTYHFEINSAGTWTKTEYVNVTLSPASGDGDDNGTNGSGNNHKTPGFELIIFMISMGFLILVFGKKRFR